MIRRGPHDRSVYFLESLHARGIVIDAAIPLLATAICAIAPGQGRVER